MDQRGSHRYNARSTSCSTPFGGSEWISSLSNTRALQRSVLNSIRRQRVDQVQPESLDIVPSGAQLHSEAASGSVVRTVLPFVPFERAQLHSEAASGSEWGFGNGWRFNFVLNSIRRQRVDQGPILYRENLLLGAQLHSEAASGSAWHCSR